MMLGGGASNDDVNAEYDTNNERSIDSSAGLRSRINAK